MYSQRLCPIRYCRSSPHTNTLSHRFLIVSQFTIEPSNAEVRGTIITLVVSLVARATDPISIALLVAVLYKICKNMPLAPQVLSLIG